MFKLICSLWLLLLSVLTALPLPTGIVEVPICSGHCPQSIVVLSFNYDGCSEGISVYDGAEVRTVNERGSQSVSSRTLFAKFAEFLAAEGGETLTAYRAINPAYADTTEASGQFYQSGAAGRLGNDGIYANTTPEGAIAEFQYHNPGVDPVVFKVQYPASPTLNISPPSGYFSSPLPFTGDANILTAPSLRAPGTLNLLIRNGAVPAGRLP
jgi:hypothetical protein